MGSQITQTALGEELGLSSIEMGKKLTDLSLRDKTTKVATRYALENNLGKNVSYIKAGKEVKMAVWNEKTIEYIKEKSLEDPVLCSQILLGLLKKLKIIEDRDTGSKVDQFTFTCIYEDFTSLFESIKNQEEFLSKFAIMVKKDDLLDYAIQLEELQDLPIVIAKHNLEISLTRKKVKEKPNKI